MKAFSLGRTDTATIRKPNKKVCFANNIKRNEKTTVKARKITKNCVTQDSTTEKQTRNYSKEYKYVAKDTNVEEASSDGSTENKNCSRNTKLKSETSVASERLKSMTKHRKMKKTSKGKEEVIKVKLLTGTLYLYRGTRRRAEFIRCR